MAELLKGRRLDFSAKFGLTLTAINILQFKTFDSCHFLLVKSEFLAMH
jgi:hypothetical protein